MFDDIIKALTLQISADDLTGGAWSSIGKEAKNLMNLATPLNQAWELGTKVFNGFSAALEYPIKALSDGGELSEAMAGLTSLGATMDVNAAKMLDLARSYSDGALTITEATKATSNAIRMGFSESQMESVWSFAQKYADVMGGEVLDIATKIEEAIFTGKGKAAKEFGLNITVGTLVDPMSIAQARSEFILQLEKLNQEKQKIIIQSEFDPIDSKKELKKIDAKIAEVKAQLRPIDIGTGVDPSGIYKAGSSITEQLELLKKKLGEGSFNFGEELQKISTSFSNAGIAIKKELNDLVGDIGFEKISSAFVTSMREVEDSAPIIALGIFKPITDAARWAITPINGFFSILKEQFDIGFSNSDTLGTKITTVIGTIGNTFYDTIKAMATALGWILTPANVFSQWAYDMNSSLLKLRLTTAEMMSSSPETIAQIKDMIATNDELKKTGLFHVDTTEITKKQQEFNKALIKTKTTSEKLATPLKEASSGIIRAGEAFDTAKGKGKELAQENMAIAKSYSEMGKGISETVKAVSSVVNETQKGINAIALAGANAAIDSKDVFGLAASEKQRQVQGYMDQLMDEKRREKDLIYLQAGAMNSLAESMQLFGTTPRRVEFSVNNGDGALRDLCAKLINLLTDMALVEGTEVLGR